MINELSENHTVNILLALQETWKYDIPRSFRKEFQEKYYFLHESAMEVTTPRQKGRPHGGIAFIISKSVAFKIKYKHSRCLSILLTKSNLLVNNVYLPANDTRKNAEANLEQMMEALGHLDGVHDATTETLDCITLGDFNYDPNDTTNRARLVNETLKSRSYDLQSDSKFLSPTEYSHQSGRRLDRIVSTTTISNCIESTYIKLNFYDSDHFPVVTNYLIEDENEDDEEVIKPILCWNRASSRALDSYSKLTHKKCIKSLNKFHRNEINGAGLYEEVVQNLTDAANSCIPKFTPGKQRRRHNIPFWKERISPYKNEVDYLVQLQFLQGGPNMCSDSLTQQLRLAKSRYRNQIRQLRREVKQNIAENITLRNCHKQLHPKAKTPTPALIDGHSRNAQPHMWRGHFKEVFSAEETPYTGNLLTDVNENISNTDISSFNYINTSELENAISLINTNKSYKRHHHWKHLNSDNHSAKRCLIEIFKYWMQHVLHDNNFINWNFFSLMLM